MFIALLKEAVIPEIWKIALVVKLPRLVVRYYVYMHISYINISFMYVYLFALTDNAVALGV
jgi:hypothetical protein